MLIAVFPPARLPRAVAAPRGFTYALGVGPRLTMGQAFKRFLEQLGDIGLLTRECVRQALRRPFEGGLLVEQLDSVGVRSLNVVNLTAIFTGMVLALQMGQFLARFGAKIYISRIMGLSLFREMGPVLTALMIGARVGAGITAELGSMKVTEQIDAMRALATSPVKKLVVPRVLATVLMLPVLTVISDAVGTGRRIDDRGHSARAHRRLFFFLDGAEHAAGRSDQRPRQGGVLRLSSSRSSRAARDSARPAGPTAWGARRPRRWWRRRSACWFRISF